MLHQYIKGILMGLSECVLKATPFVLKLRCLATEFQILSFSFATQSVRSDKWTMSDNPYLLLDTEQWNKSAFPKVMSNGSSICPVPRPLQIPSQTNLMSRGGQIIGVRNAPRPRKNFQNPQFSPSFSAFFRVPKNSIKI